MAVQVATAYDFYVSGYGATVDDNNDDAAVSIGLIVINWRNSFVKAVNRIKKKLMFVIASNLLTQIATNLYTSAGLIYRYEIPHNDSLSENQC